MRTKLPRITGLSDVPIALPQFMDEVPVGIVVLDPDRRVVLLNRTLEALTGFVPEEARGVPCRYVLRSNLCFDVCPVLKAAENSESVCVEANIINRGREKIPVRVSAAPVLDLKGNLVAFVESVEDMRILQAPTENGARSFAFGKFIGRSPEIQRILHIIPVIAQTDSSILITGETGTGKDFVAEAIHQASDRARGPFIKVNCGALPEALLESELFGHQKGAFTGAVENKPGRFKLAHNGTLYLTEIGDLPLNLQVKLLSFLDDKVLHPLGSTKGVHVDVRVIAATHRNLEQMVREGRFRQDLLFRLNVIRLHLPPLARRTGDVKMLMDHFLHTFNPRFGKKVKSFDTAAHDTLLAYRYPGNVRELRNIIEYAVNVSNGHVVTVSDLPEYLTHSEPFSEVEHLFGEQESAPEQMPEPRSSDLKWEDAERGMIMDAMKKARGRRSEAAEILGWARSTLWRKMKRYGIIE
ncbi:MAG: sigma 54-interacting transcriptional regulator [Thermodesulfobacteriota bacterium]